MSYKIIRSYREYPSRKPVIKRGLTLEEAQAHCRDPQTHSKECTTPEGLEDTRMHGAWFDCYELDKGYKR